MSHSSAWEDMGLYWAYRGDGSDYSPEPPEKHIEYVDLNLIVPMKLAVKVRQGDEVIEVNKNLLDFYQRLINEYAITLSRESAGRTDSKTPRTSEPA